MKIAGVSFAGVAALRSGVVISGQSLSVGRDGRGDWIRTSDPHTPSVMRYQAALRPDRVAAIGGDGASSQPGPARQGRKREVEWLVEGENRSGWGAGHGGSG